MKDGRPQVSPIWIDIDDNNNIILFNTAQGRIKQKNISRDPRVSLSLVDKNNPYSMVTIQGTVIEQTTIGADEHIDKLAKKYLEGFYNLCLNGKRKKFSNYMAQEETLRRTVKQAKCAMRLILA